MSKCFIPTEEKLCFHIILKSIDIHSKAHYETLMLILMNFLPTSSNDVKMPNNRLHRSLKDERKNWLLNCRPPFKPGEAVRCMVEQAFLPVLAGKYVCPTANFFIEG